MAGLHVNRGAKRAREARAELALDPAAPLACLLDTVEGRPGLAVVVAPLPEPLAGACVPVGCGRLLFVNGGQARVRQRFTLAHELGHAWCGHDGRLPVETIATVTGRATSAEEIEANAFAGEFLIPRAALEALFTADPTLDELTTVGAAFGTSTIMTLVRFGQLGLISEAGYAAREADLDARRHGEAWTRLGLTGRDDRLGALSTLPYLSPALHDTRLGAVLRGDAAAEPALATAIARLLM